MAPLNCCRRWRRTAGSSTDGASGWRTERRWARRKRYLVLLVHLFLKTLNIKPDGTSSTSWCTKTMWAPTTISLRSSCLLYLRMPITNASLSIAPSYGKRRGRRKLVSRMQLTSP
ncbi:Protein of unknown function [Gryllus bimaculatus]|nr:Protein of unknown function [Gryllus bimaculatus]